ncbi:helix-turn-helix transcriptional regulator [Streptomyces sp. KMM 9044]|uniref:helix-turn-helix transcriptional regulator n=1 Tax=Streptomyces sp. KMM 9044 TaxID=2744474 RepID=UPI002150AB91|nr:metalloregulator ArsR/SmtB family transcription factor [Streptomyces sp. KMM 9044]WAX80646.1 transcriptional regulator [Streptomyces sp. KMM 9044]
MKNVGEAPQEELATGERSTRNRVARSVLDHGPSTVSELAQRLGLTQAAVRRHLDTLAGDGIVEARERRVYGARTRGRPAKVFALTDCGRDAFDQSYDKLAVDALHWIGEQEGGDEAITAFARARIAAQAGAYRTAVETAAPEERAQALARALTADGYSATARSAPHPQQGEQLCQHHCPVAHAAERFPQLCEAETEFFAELLGTHVQRLATIAHGDGVCTTFIPKSSTASTGQAGTEAPQAPPPPKPGRPPGASGTKTKKNSLHIHNESASASTAGRNPA